MKCIVKLSVIRKNLSKFTKPVILMVKANAYGHGVGLIQSVQDKVVGFGVATEDEGVYLRSYTTKPIIVTAPDHKKAPLVVKYGLTPLVNSGKQLCALWKAANAQTVVHLKIDSGMGRFGTQKVSETIELCNYAKSLGNISVKGIATHFASQETVLEQCKKFDRHVAAAESVYGRLLRHASASATTLMTDYDMLRIGYAAYQDAMRVTSSVCAVKKIKAGRSVGYGSKYTASKDQDIAVIYGGYADGLKRNLIGYKVTIRDKKHKIIAVCMDVIIVELTAKCCVDDQVIIINGKADWEKMAIIADTIPYELFVGMVGRCQLEYEN